MRRQEVFGVQPQGRHRSRRRIREADPGSGIENPLDRDGRGGVGFGDEVALGGAFFRRLCARGSDRAQHGRSTTLYSAEGHVGEGAATRPT